MTGYKSELDMILEKRMTSTSPDIASVFEKLNGKHVVLYGAGAFGMENGALFKKHGVVPYAFLDKNAQKGAEKMGIPIFHPDDKSLTESFRKSCRVYISITVGKKTMAAIKKYLTNFGYLNCDEVQKITARQVKYDGIKEENPDTEYLKNEKEKIYNALELMKDEESRATYISNIRAHFLRDYEHCYETDFPVQYFDAGVPYSRGFSRFVDCGAYTGDSLENVLKFSNVDFYAGFEPIVSNFTILSKTVDKLKSNINNAFLFPCGVASQTGSAKFSVSASSSTITDENDTDGVLFPLIRLDDAIKNVPVTFLKMDIEGAEPSAIKGGENLISTQKPDLAISVYHSVNHLWDIPNLINSFNCNYRFYLRVHTSATLETVLYAL